MLLAGQAAGATAAELLRFFSSSSTSGTLLLQRGDASCYMLLHDGKWLLQREVGMFGAADEPCDSWSYQLHERSELPEARSGGPGLGAAAFRALPLTGAGQQLMNGATDLPLLFEYLRSSAFTGSLMMNTAGEAALVLLLKGRIGAAVFEREQFVWQRSDALRSLQRYLLQADGQLQLTPLDTATILSLLGVALDSRAGNTEPASFTGVLSTDSGYLFHQQGTPYLLVRTPPLVAGVHYGLPDELPDLRLPRGNPGWEQLRYDLTLRGRDALIPMTELSMEFSEEFGREGRQILDALLAGLSLEETAARLASDLSDLKPWLDRLEHEGLIHARKQPRTS